MDELESRLDDAAQDALEGLEHLSSIIAHLTPDARASHAVRTHAADIEAAAENFLEAVYCLLEVLDEKNITTDH